MKEFVECDACQARLSEGKASGGFQIITLCGGCQQNIDTIVDYYNYVQKILQALDLPEDASIGCVLDQIRILKNG